MPLKVIQKIAGPITANWRSEPFQLPDGPAIVTFQGTADAGWTGAYAHLQMATSDNPGTAAASTDWATIYCPTITTELGTASSPIPVTNTNAALMKSSGLSKVRFYVNFPKALVSIYVATSTGNLTDASVVLNG